MALLSMQDLGLFQDQFSGVSVPTYISPLLIFILFWSFSTSSNHFFLGFPVEHFPSGIFLDPFFRVLSSYILSTCPNHRSFPFLIYEIIFGCSYRSINSCLVRILHTPFGKSFRASLLCVTTKYSGICGPKLMGEFVSLVYDTTKWETQLVKYGA